MMKRLSSWPIRWDAIRAVAGSFFITRLMLGIVIYLSMVSFPVTTQPGLLYADPHNIVIDGLVRFDSWWYHNIITFGYNMGNIATGEQGNVAFFPLYPFLIKSAMFLTGNIFRAGLLVSNTAFCITLYYLYLLTEREFSSAAARRTVFYYACAPTALFFSAMYTESVFMALTIATFYYAGSKRIEVAAITGALAAATRNTGVLLGAVVVLEGLAWHGWRWQPSVWSRKGVLDHLREQLAILIRSWWVLCAGIFVGLGLLGYISYLTAEFGDPLAFIHVQATWGRNVSSSGLLSLFSNTVRELNIGRIWQGEINPAIALDCVMTLLFGGMLIAVGRKMRLAYILFVVLTFLVPLTTGTVSSVSRYVLMLFPCWMVLGEWGERPWVDRLVLAISLPLMAYNAILFSHWQFAG